MKYAKWAVKCHFNVSNEASDLTSLRLAREGTRCCLYSQLLSAPVITVTVTPPPLPAPPPPPSIQEKCRCSQLQFALADCPPVAVTGREQHRAGEWGCARKEECVRVGNGRSEDAVKLMLHAG